MYTIYVPIYKKVNKNFFKKWTGEMAYVVGFFAADGYLVLNKRGANFWNIQITDKKLLVAIRNVVGAEHKISVKIRTGNESTIYRLQIGSKEMCGDLKRLGFRRKKAYNLIIPDVPAKYFPDFVRGYFDGDGNVWMGLIHKERTNPYLTLTTMFTSCSLPFLRALHRTLHTFGLEGGCIYISKKNYARLQLSAHDSLKLYDIMYTQPDRSQHPLFLNRKKKVFERFKILKNIAAVV